VYKRKGIVLHEIFFSFLREKKKKKKMV